MKTIKILGTGCPNCKQMEKIVQSVINQLNLNIKIEKVEDIQEIMKYNIMSTPALVIDNIVVVKGRVPSLAEVIDLLKVESCCSGSDDSCCNGGGHNHDQKNNSNNHSHNGTCCGGENHSHSDCCENDHQSEKESCCDSNSGCC